MLDGVRALSREHGWDTAYHWAVRAYGQPLRDPYLAVSLVMKGVGESTSSDRDVQGSPKGGHP
jgi:hypothetical protein